MFYKHNLLVCDWEDGFVSPNKTFIRLAAGPFLYALNAFKALQAENRTIK